MSIFHRHVYMNTQSIWYMTCVECGKTKAP